MMEDIYKMEVVNFVIIRYVLLAKIKRKIVYYFAIKIVKPVI